MDRPAQPRSADPRAAVVIGSPDTFQDTRVVDDGEPFRILVLADLSGEPAAGDLPHYAIDRDDLDAAMQAVGPTVELVADVTGEATTLRFEELEDFHPDRLAERLPLFRTRTPAEGSPVAAERHASLLEDILEKAAPTPLSELPTDDLRSFVRSVTRPHEVSEPTAAQRARTEERNEAAAETLRRVLRHPRFRALEATWRALAWLTNRLETGGRLQLQVAHISREQLPIAVDGDAGLENLIATVRPALIVALFSFGEADLELARGLGRLARRHGITVVAGAEPGLVGAASGMALNDPGSWGTPPVDWTAFRRSSEAEHLMLALPRFLVRSPYGADGEAVEALPFEELRAPIAHEDFVWGNSAVLCAALVAETFLAEGWSMRVGRFREVDGLPIPLIRDDEVRAVPCAEVVLTESAAAALIARGPTVVATIRDTDRVRVVRFQSFAEPPSEPRGAWTS